MQQKAAKDLMHTTHEKVLARVIAKDYLKHVRQNVLGILADQGVFRRPFEMDLYAHILPWMYGTTSEMMEEDKKMDEILQNMVETAFNRVVFEHGDSLDKERKRKTKKKQEEEAKKEARRIEREKRKLEKEEKKRIEDLQILQKKIEKELVNKGENKAEMLKQECTEINGNFQSSPAIGVPGGMLTGLAIALASAYELSANKDWFNETNIYKFFTMYIAEMMGCPQFSIYIGPELAQLLTSKGIKFDNLSAMDEETEKSFVGMYVAGEHDDNIMKIIRDKSAENNLDPKFTAILREAILKLTTKKMNEKEMQGNIFMLNQNK